MFYVKALTQEKIVTTVELNRKMFQMETDSNPEFYIKIRMKYIRWFLWLL